VGYEAEVEAIPYTAEQEAALLALALEHDRDAMAELESARSRDELFYALPHASIASFRLGEHARAQSLARQALDLVAVYDGSWNRGNAIHYGHTTLGLLALNEGDVGGACKALLASGATPGSPQLNTFGPTMQLARALVRAGEADVVLEYLGRCRAFWVMGGTWLDLWEAKIRKGELPNFAMGLYR
jgi:hypothetical protein